MKLRDEASGQFQTASKKIGASAEQTETQVNKTSKAMNALGSAVKGFIGAVATREVIRWLGDSVREAAAAETALNKLNNALKVSGQYTPTVSASLQAYSKELQKITVVEDDVAVAAMGLIATLTKLDSEGIKKATQAAIGLSRTFGMELQQAATLVAKAIHSDTNALGRYGISLGEAKTESEKLTVIVEKTAGMFTIAQKETETYAGQLQQLKNDYKNLMEQVGEMLLPVLQDFLGILKTQIDAFNKLNPATQTFYLKLGLVAAIAGPLVVTITNLANAYKALGLAQLFAAGAGGGAGGALAGGAVMRGGTMTGGAGVGLSGLAMHYDVREIRKARQDYLHPYGAASSLTAGFSPYQSNPWTVDFPRPNMGLGQMKAGTPKTGGGGGGGGGIGDDAISLTELYQKVFDLELRNSIDKVADAIRRVWSESVNLAKEWAAITPENNSLWNTLDSMFGDAAVAKIRRFRDAIDEAYQSTGYSKGLEAGQQIREWYTGGGFSALFQKDKDGNVIPRTRGENNMMAIQGGSQMIQGFQQGGTSGAFGAAGGLNSILMATGAVTGPVGMGISAGISILDMLFGGGKNKLPSISKPIDVRLVEIADQALTHMLGISQRRLIAVGANVSRETNTASQLRMMD